VPVTPKTYKRFPGLRFYDCDQGTPEWLKERHTVGSSEASAAFAGGSGKTRIALMDRKIIERHTGEPVETFSSASMSRGIRLEKEAVAWFERATGLETIEVGLIRNREYPGFHASLDRLIIFKGLLVSLEIKCPERKTHLKYLKDWKLPTTYKKQVDEQQIICNTIYSFFLSWHPEHGQMLLKVPAPTAIERVKYETDMNRWNNDLADRLPMAKQIVEEHKARAARLETEEAELIQLARIKTEALLKEIR